MVTTAVRRQDSLNDRQRRFVSEYVVDWNGTAAAIRAGYSPRSAEVTASRMLRIPKVQAAIQQELRAAERRNHVSKDRVVQELAAIAFAELRDIAPWTALGPVLVPSDDLTPAQSAAVQSLKLTRTRIAGSDDTAWEVERIEVKLHDKQRALDMLMKHLGGYAPVQVDHRVAVEQRVAVLVERVGLSEEEAREALAHVAGVLGDGTTGGNGDSGVGKANPEILEGITTGGDG